MFSKVGVGNSLVGFDSVLGFDTGLVQAFGTGLVGFGNIFKTLRGF